MTKIVSIALKVLVHLWLITDIVPVTATVTSVSAEHSKPGNGKNSSISFNINSQHVIVFFDHRVRYHTHEADNAYSKTDLTHMINVVSSRFTKLLIDTAPKLPKLPPNDDAPSRIWIPSLIAEHNNHNPTSPKLEVIVSFEFDVDIYTGGVDPSIGHYEETSFDVARYMANEANHIHPGTVTTLMMTMYHTEKLEYADESQDYSYWQYMQDWSNEDKLEQMYVEHVHHLVYPYKLGVFMDIHDCGRFKGQLAPKVLDILPFVEVIALFIDPTNFHHLTTLVPAETRKMFISKFEDCERKLKEAKPEIRVVPSALWKSHHLTISSMVEDWEGMSNWAVENDKEVIMYEAFDTPGGRDFYYWGHGWWRLRDRTAYQINETSFVEKIEDANSEIYTKTIYSSIEESSEEQEVHKNSTMPPPTTSSSHVAPSISYHPHPPPPPSTTIIHTSSNANHGLYIILVLLSVICMILVVAQIYFHSKVIKNSGHYGRGVFRKENCHSFVNPGLISVMDPDGMNEISLTNQNYRSPNRQGGNGEGSIEDDAGVASMEGSVLEMSSDTSPIVSVAYKNKH